MRDSSKKLPNVSYLEAVLEISRGLGLRDQTGVSIGTKRRWQTSSLEKPVKRELCSRILEGRPLKTVGYTR